MPLNTPQRNVTTPEALLRPVMILMSGRSAGFVVAFAIPMVLARLFDQNDFGTYKQLFLIYATLFGIAQLGMAESLYYFLPMQKDRGNAYIANAIIVTTGAGVICLLVLLTLATPIADWMNNPGLVPHLPLLGLYVVFMLPAVLLEIIMTVRRRHREASLAYALSDLARAGLYVIPVWFIPDMRWLMVGAVTFAALRFIAAIMYIRVPGTCLVRTDRLHFKRHLAYALPFGLAGLIEVAQINFHLYAVSYHFDAATFAIYAVGCLQIPLIDILMTSTSNVMMVSMRQKAEDNDRAAVCAIWLDSVRKLALILFPLVSLLLVLAPVLIVFLFTSAYEESVPIFMVWTASTLFICLLSDGVLRVYAETRFLILQNIVRLVVIMLLINTFLASFGLMGAVLVTTLATAVTKLIAMMRVKALLGVTVVQLLPWRSLAGTALAAAVAALPAAWVMRTFVPESMPAMALLLALSCVAFVVSYLALLLFAGPLAGQEKRQLISWIGHPVSVLSRALKQPL